MKRASELLKNVANLLIFVGIIVGFFFLVDLFAGKKFGVVRTVNHLFKIIWGLIVSIIG